MRAISFMLAFGGVMCCVLDTFPFVFPKVLILPRDIRSSKGKG